MRKRENKIGKSLCWVIMLLLFEATVIFHAWGNTENEETVEHFHNLEVESRLLLFVEEVSALSVDLSDFSAKQLDDVQDDLFSIDIRWSTYCQAQQVEIANSDVLLDIVASYQRLKQNVTDSIQVQRHSIESLENFSNAEKFIKEQEVVYEDLLSSAKEYALIKSLAPLLEKVKGKEQLLFPDIQKMYEVAKGAAQEFPDLQSKMDNVEECFIKLKNSSAEIQALEYKPLLQRIKDYLFSFAAVAIILMFFNMVQAKIQMIKQASKKAKEYEEMMKGNQDDYPTI